MEPIKRHINEFLYGRPPSEAQAAARLSQAWDAVADPAIKKYTGSVIYDKNKPDVVVVYTTDPAVKAELMAEKELYRLKLSRALRGDGAEPLQELRFAVSRRTALAKAEQRRQEEDVTQPCEPLPLTAEEEGHARESLSGVADQKLKQSLFKAMKSNLEWKKGREASKTP